MRSLVAMMVVVTVVAGGCTSDQSVPTGESASPPMTITTTSTSVPATTTTSATPEVTTTSVFVPEPHTLQPLAATPYEVAPLVWRDTGVTFERRHPHEYWVGSTGDRFVFVEYDWPSGGLAISTSVDGAGWERASLPETVGADEVPLSEWAVVHVATGGAGVVVVLNQDPVGHEQLAPSHLLISTDGRTFVESDLSGVEGRPTPSNPASIAAGTAGFAIITEGATPRRDPENWLYLSTDGVEWQLVDIPDTHRDLGWVEALGDGWIAQGPYLGRMPDNAYPVYVIGPDAAVELRTAPWDFLPQSWGDQVLMDVYAEQLVDDHLGEVPSFYATKDALSWWRLPFPDQGSLNDQDYAAWHVETIAGGPDDQLLILGCGEGCVGAWDFYGDNFLPVTIHHDDWGVEISGNYVAYFNGSAWKSLDNAPDFYDPATETLTIVEDGRTIAAITCDQMRQAAIDAPWHAESGDGLTTLPDEALWHSNNGTSWHEQAVDELFGTESYVFAAAMTNDLALAVVTPNGDRQVADPLGCELGLYPPEQPVEIWIAQLP